MMSVISGNVSGGLALIIGMIVNVMAYKLNFPLPGVVGILDCLSSGSFISDNADVCGNIFSSSLDKEEEYSDKEQASERLRHRIVLKITINTFVLVSFF